MDKNDPENIVIYESGSVDSGGIQLPLNFVTVGKLENDDVRVYVKQDVYKNIEKLASSDTSKELGSILIGDYSKEMGKTHVIVSNYIEAKYTDASASTLTFTHETWDYVHKEHEKLYPDMRIIGWQHTHPGYGIFLSNYDMFIQENFFNMDFQVAYVVDPLQNLRGFFQWKGGKVEKLNGFYVYDEVGKPIKLEAKESTENEQKNSHKVSKLASILCIILLICTIGLSVYAVSLGNRYKKQITRQKQLSGEAAQQKEVIDKQADSIKQLQEALEKGILTKPDVSAIEELISKLESKEIVTANQEGLIKDLKEYLEDYKAAGTTEKESFIVYTVKAGDTLSSICAENKVDYKAYSGLIYAINGIKDPNLINEGQTLLLPALGTGR